MRLSTLLLAPFASTLVLASPNPLAHPNAAPAPTPGPDLAHAVIRLPHDRRQLSFSLFGATAVLSNGVLCGGIGILTGCFGSTGTNSVTGTIDQSGGTVSGSGFTFAISDTSTDSVTTYTSTSTGGAVPERTAMAALAAGVGAVVVGLL